MAVGIKRGERGEARVFQQIMRGPERLFIGIAHGIEGFGGCCVHETETNNEQRLRQAESEDSMPPIESFATIWPRYVLGSALNMTRPRSGVPYADNRFGR